MKKKVCSQCKTENQIGEFFNHARSKDGKTATCKKCILKKQKEYYQRNREKALAGVKKYAAKNKALISQKSKKYYQDNKEKILLKAKEYANKNKTKIKKYHKEYKKDPKNKKAHNQRCMKYYKNNKHMVNRRNNKRWRSDSKFRLGSLISCRVRLSLKFNKNGKSWESLVGYTVNDLEQNLKRKIPKGHTWKDFLTGKLHIDHKIPVAAFNFNSPTDIDFKRCWALKNLQLLPAKENIKKGSKLTKPFQPSLAGI